MSERISIPELRNDASGAAAMGLDAIYFEPRKVLALVEAVEAARAFTERIAAKDFPKAKDRADRLDDALARFDFGDAT